MKKFTKRILSAVLALILAFSVLTVVPFASQATLAVAVDKSSCLQGDTIVATIYFPSSYNNAAALDVELKYDRSKLEFVSLERGAGLESALDAQLNGKVYSEYTKNPGIISWVLAGSNNFEFSGTFAVITFKIRTTAANGNTTLDLEVTNASNSGYIDLTSSFVTSDAVVDIIRNSVNDFVFELNDNGTGYIITAYHCATVSDLVIPSAYKNLPVVGIGDGVFYNHGELKSITLPENLEFIGESAFNSCSGISEIIIPDTVVSIGDGAFLNCGRLENVKLPLGLEKIGANTFYSCYFLEEIEIPFTVKEIGETAFYNCYALSSVKISKNTTTIAKNAFEKCFSGGIEFTTVEGNTYLPEVIAESYPKSTIKLVEDISLGAATCVDIVDYTGAPQTPEVSVKLDNETQVAEGTDYKVVYVNNTNAGTAKAYVVGINGYGEGYVLGFDIYCEHSSVRKIVIQKLTCTNDGVYRCKCTVCGDVFDEVTPAAGHPSGKWVYDRYPSYKETGIKHKVCSVCGGEYELNTVADKIIPDVDLNGNVNSTDALLILQRAVGTDVYISPEGLLNADANGDGKINSTDALLVLQISVGKIQLG